MMGLRVIRKEPGGEWFYDIIRNDLESLQACVSGYIETVTLYPEAGGHVGVVLICNEEGRLHRLPYNCKVKDVPFVGPLVVVGAKGENFVDAPVTTRFLNSITEA